MSKIGAVMLASGFAFAACGGTAEPGDGATDASTVFDECSGSSDCVVRSASCCGQCGAATREDIVAINRQKATQYSTSTCGDALGCPACFMEQDARLVSTCRSGRCEVVDLAVHQVTACANDTECRVRTSSCCECGGDIDRAHLFAISVASDQAFSALVCDPGEGCPECAPVYPPEAAAKCTSGHCEVVWAR